MVSVEEQINRGAIVCPLTHKPLVYDGGNLVSSERTRYGFAGTVPILLGNPAAAEEYAHGSEKMNSEYAASVGLRTSVIGKINRFLDKDYRTKKSRDAFEAVISSAPADSICLSIGGGPARQDLKLINLNVGPFPNVDVVADAHQLPYRDESVDHIYCEAVLEHLEDPTKAVGEMWRVIKPGGQVFAVTPFMVGFHGYPNHFQNFTVIGHALKFSKAGFDIVDSGTCVGPVFTMVGMIAVFITEYFPKPLRKPLRIAWRVIGSAIKPLDLILARSESSHVLAASSYVFARKPS